MVLPVWVSFPILLFHFMLSVSRFYFFYSHAHPLVSLEFIISHNQKFFLFLFFSNKKKLKKCNIQTSHRSNIENTKINNPKQKLNLASPQCHLHRHRLLFFKCCGLPSLFISIRKKEKKRKKQRKVVYVLSS